MTTYNFTFPGAAAGLWASVYDFLGNPVGTGVLTASGDNAVASFDLPTGTYTARMAGIDGDQSMVRPDDTSPTLGLTGEQVYFEASEGGTIEGDATIATIEFDVLPENLTDAGDLPAGLYMVDVTVNFSQPTESRSISVSIVGPPNYTEGPYIIGPGGSAARNLGSNFLVIRTGNSPLGVTLRLAVDPDAVDPGDLVYGYAYAAFTPITA